MKLVNFDLEHVPLYEKWYEDKELLGIHILIHLQCKTIELTATEPMDHTCLVTSQAMYADDDDSILSYFN